MRLDIRPFAAEHIDEAAVLLAHRHAINRQREPRLPSAFTEASVTRPLLEALATQASGVAAFDGRRMAGYLLGMPEFEWTGRARLTPMEGHAVEHEDGVELYREMYAAAAPAWVDEGYFSHTVNVPAGDEAAFEAFFSLGFGQMLVFGMRDTVPLDNAPARIRIDRAAPSDIDAVEALMGSLSRFNSMPPLFRPYVASPDRGPERREARLREMGDEAYSYQLAYEGEEPAGLMIFMPPEPSELMLNPERGTYLWIAYVKPEARSGGLGRGLLENGLAWARSKGYECCSVGWFAANISGARFWTRNGFRPALYRLERKLDERIAWAKARG